MRGLYNLLFSIFLLLSAPRYLARMWRRGNWRDNFEQRFGKYSSKVKQSITNRHLIWLHAVSVGEVNVCTQVIRALEPRVPNLKIVVSTTTSTGMQVLHDLLPSHILKIYYPIDRRKYVERALRTIHPQAVVLIEAEIWPNFLWHLQEWRIPAFLVNARLSDRSYRGYKRFAFLFRPLFQSFCGVGCQNETDASRLLDLGCRKETIRIVGNLKFDAAKLEERKLLDVAAILRQLGVPDQRVVLVGGSTHAGEEGVLAEIFLRLKQEIPELFLLLAPRHFERGKAVGKELESRGIPFYYRSNMGAQTQLGPGQVQALVLNTTGELRYFYEHADAIFIGKSLTAEGGQNPLEAGALAKPMVFGPNMQNFQAVAQALVDRAGAWQVRDADELEAAMRILLTDPERAAQQGQNALSVVRENLGAIERTVDMILERLKESDAFGMGDAKG